MKKLLSIVLILAISVFAFVGCTQDQPEVPETPVVEEPKVEEPVVEEPVVEEPKVEEPLAEGAVKTGLAVVSSIEKSKDAGEKDGISTE